MSFILKIVGKSVVEKHLAKYEPADPVYEEYVDEDGKKHTRKRELPPGLSKRDAKILKSVKRRARRLDRGFNLCGMKFGWTFIIALIPVVGDITDGILGYTLIIRKAKQAEIPGWLVREMMVNTFISVGCGMVPLVGDVALAAWKGNSRNAHALERYLRARGEEELHPKAPENDKNWLKPGAGLEGGEKPGDGTSEDAKPISASKADKIVQKNVKQTEKQAEASGSGTGKAKPKADL